MAKDELATEEDLDELDSLLDERIKLLDKVDEANFEKRKLEIQLSQAHREEVALLRMGIRKTRQAFTGV